MSKVEGLAGVIATQSSISSIIDDQLTYVGYRIDDLAEHSTFEEVIYLLWNMKLPTRAELDTFKKELTGSMELPEEIIEHLRLFDLEHVHPMAALRSAISLLGVYDREAEATEPEATRRKAIRIQGQIVTIITTFARLRKGLEPLKPLQNVSLAENFLYMLNERKPEPIEIEAIDKALILHADHELNASTFTARVCVVTLSDIYSGITAAISALKGPLHGGANEAVMKMLKEIGDVDNVKDYVDKKLANKEVIMGMGHRVYKKGDPRAKHLKAMSRKLTKLRGQEKWYDMSVLIEEYVKEKKNLPANVDFYSASVYDCLGIDHDLFTPVFAVSRVSGWVAHILEQYSNNRLIRPRAEYTGPRTQSYVPIEER